MGSRYEGEFELYVGVQHKEMSVRIPRPNSAGLRLTNEDQKLLRKNLMGFSKFQPKANVRVFQPGIAEKDKNGKTIPQPALTPAKFQKLVEEHVGNFVVLKDQNKQYTRLYLAALDENPHFTSDSNSNLVWKGE
mgnify:CR=1 FL=1|tara:strand:+ start:907 stop:1308 length:402 start_codon:yes stop_codon:yes gene_type:complete